jgi:hypothetical protein
MVIAGADILSHELLRVHHAGHEHRRTDSDHWILLQDMLSLERPTSPSRKVRRHWRIGRRRRRRIKRRRRGRTGTWRHPPVSRQPFSRRIDGPGVMVHEPSFSPLT